MEVARGGGHGGGWAVFTEVVEVASLLAAVFVVVARRCCGGVIAEVTQPFVNRTPSFSLPQSSPHVQYGNVNRSTRSIHEPGHRGHRFNSANQPEPG